MIFYPIINTISMYGKRKMRRGRSTIASMMNFSYREPRMRDLERGIESLLFDLIVQNVRRHPYKGAWMFDLTPLFASQTALSCKYGIDTRL